MTALPKPAYVMSEPHLSGWRVVLGYETLADAQAAQSAVSAPEAREGEAGWFGDKDYEPTEAMIDAGMEHCRPGNHANMIDSFKAMMAQAELDGLVSHTHPAAPSADKLRAALSKIAHSHVSDAKAIALAALKAEGA